LCAWAVLRLPAGSKPPCKSLARTPAPAPAPADDVARLGRHPNASSCGECGPCFSIPVDFASRGEPRNCKASIATTSPPTRPLKSLTFRTTKMHLPFFSAALLFAVSVFALDTPLDIKVTQEATCDRKTQKGDKIEVHYRGTLESDGAFRRPPQALQTCSLPTGSLLTDFIAQALNSMPRTTVASRYPSISVKVRLSKAGTRVCWICARARRGP
jgi:hypothetical protein